MAREGPIVLWVIMAVFLNQQTERPVSNTALVVAIGIGVLLMIAFVLVSSAYHHPRNILISPKAIINHNKSPESCTEDVESEEKSASEIGIDN